MSSRELPVLNFAPFRNYPTKREQQEFTDDRQVCHGCLSGVCCSNQDPIALTAFDILRLASFFDMSPARFMLTFTQDEFDGEAEDYRRERSNDPDTSVVTWLRRRTNLATSPCVFLKYIREPDGTPRRICSVHEGRPLSCREFYFDPCKVRGTGELASLLAEGLEKIRDGEITDERVDAELAKFGAHDSETATLAENMAYFFWVEMKCAVNMEQANIEGSNSYEMTDYQDPIDEKLNRVLSTKYLRFEEAYGAKPHDEQLMPYTAGLSFARSAEFERIMAVVSTPPSSGLYALGNYPHYVGLRTMIPGVKHSALFPVIPDAEIDSFLDATVPALLFPHHDLPEVRAITQRDVYAALLKAFKHLIRFSSYVVALDPILEDERPGTIEVELFKMLASFETSLNPYIAANPYLQPIKHHMAKVALDLLEEDLAAAKTPEDVFDCLRLSCILQTIESTLPLALFERVEAVNQLLQTKLRKDEPELYVRLDNPVEARRAAGKRLRFDRAWEDWRRQILDMRYAAFAGFNRIELEAFYRRSIDDLGKIPFRKGYVARLRDIVEGLAESMSFNHRIASQDMSYKDEAKRLAAYAARLFDWMEKGREENVASNSVTELLPSVYKHLGLSYNDDRRFGLAIKRLLDSQLADGSWKTNPRVGHEPDSQGEYLELMYRATWAAVDALRPLRNDALNPANAALGLS
jgi:Fe-S-cluster containining protein